MSEAFSPESPHFFKIILDETLREKKLLIPKKFVRLYGKSLSNLVCVKLPCGSEWEMGVLEHGGQVWLGKGWERFVEHYSIVRGHVICFRYEGNSRFEAVIFDTSTVEIDYPCKRRNCEEGRSVEISDDFAVHPRRRKNVQSPCTRDGKRRRTSPVEEPKIDPCSSKPKGPLCDHVVQQGSERKGGSWSFDSEIEGKKDLPSTNGTECKQSPLSHNLSEDFKFVKDHDRYKRFAASQKADCFTSDRPFFKVVMVPNYVSNYVVNIPMAFAKKYIENKSTTVFLKVRNGRNKKWPVKQNLTPNGRNNIKATLSCGWIEFVRENSVEVDDVCVFVLLKERIKVTYEVVIFRVKENSERPNSSGFRSGSTQSSPNKTKHEVDIENRTHEDNDRLFESDFISIKPFFKICIKPSYAGVQSFMHIPRDIEQKYFKKEGIIILRVPNRGSWPVQFKVWHSMKTGQRSGNFASGWKVFAKGNNLKAGDVCIFQLIDAKETAFEVSIIRDSNDPCRQQFKEESNSKSKGTRKNETSTYYSGEKSRILKEEATTRKKALTISEKTKFLERAYFKSEKPFFKVVVQPSYSSIGFYMHVPYDFAKKYIKEDTDGFLCVQNGTRSWPVHFKFKRSNLGRDSAEISTGWKEFAETNNLGVADVCIFELANKTDITFVVYIVRAGIDDSLQRGSQDGDSSKCSDKIQRETKRVKIEVD